MRIVKVYRIITEIVIDIFETKCLINLAECIKFLL